MRKDYATPRIRVVEMQFEEAILGGCKNVGDGSAAFISPLGFCADTNQYGQPGCSIYGS